MVAVEPAAFGRARMRVLAPGSAREALELAREHDAPLVAGASALQLIWGRAAQWPLHIVSLQRLATYGSRLVTSAEASLGALTSLAVLERDSDLTAWPMLGEAVRSVGAPGVRHIATLGGNVAYRGDLLPALLVMDATVDAYSLAEGPQRLRIADWLAIPAGDSLLLGVQLPRPDAGGRREYFEKFGYREAFNPPVLTVAATVGREGPLLLTPRLAVSAGGSVVRLGRSESWLAGQALGTETWEGLYRCIEEELWAAASLDDYLRSVAARLLSQGLRARCA